MSVGHLEANPHTADGKPIFLPNLFPGTVTMYITGSGDDVTNGRGAGPLFGVARNDAGDAIFEWYYNDWIYLAGGGLVFKDADIGDWISLGVFAPKTEVTAAPNNDGNCNLVNGVVIVPSYGQPGAYNVDLATAVLIPADTDDDDKGPGYWSWNTPDTGHGTISPGTPGESQYHLLNVEMLLGRFVNRMPLMGSGILDITVPAIKPKKILPHWRFRVTVHNELGSHNLKVGWYVVGARVLTV